MKTHSRTPEDWELLREKVLGLGRQSIRKSYYPELQQRIGELERFRMLFEHTHEAILTFEIPSEQIADMNHAAREYFALSNGADTGESLSSALPGKFYDDVAGVIRDWDGVSPCWRSLAATHSRPDGVPMDLEVDVGLVPTNTGQYGVVICKDMTERKRAEANLAQLARVVEQTAEAVIVTDAEGRIVYVNPAFEHLTGYHRDEVLGENPRVLKSGKHPREYYERLWTTITQGGVWKGALVNRRKDGALYTEDATISPLKDANGQIVNYVAVKRDITKEIELENRLRQAQKMEAIGTLAGGIAHDFNNILSAILGYSFLARQETEGNPALMQYIDEVMRAGERATDLVRQILRFSRPALEKRQSLQLAHVIKEAIKLLRGSLPSTIEIRQNVAMDCREVYADPTEIHQVMMNLCTNAYHAMHEKGGVLEVSLADGVICPERRSAADEAPSGGCVCLTIKDTGCGMDESTLRRIFDPYFTTKEPGQGTGLGLATVSAIVEGCGGTISVESQVGIGSVFRVYLPACSASGLLHETGSVASSLPHGSERVLFVDDEPAIAAIVSRCLTRLGYAVKTCHNGKEAVGLFQAHPDLFDLVITDFTMPRMTGVALGARLREIRPDIKLLLCSGGNDALDLELAYETGFGAFLNKPLALAELANTVRQLLDSEGSLHA